MYKKMNVSSIIFYIQFPSKYLSAIKMPQKTTGQKENKTKQANENVSEIYHDAGTKSPTFKEH